MHSYNYGYKPGTYYGGRGALKEGIFTLSRGTVLNVVVGQRGGDSVEVKGGESTTRTAAELGLSVEDNAGTGGGGGSFVYARGNVLLLAAGGGGVLLVDITVWMVSRVLVAKEVWVDTLLKLAMEERGDSQVNVTLEVLVTIGEWVRVGWLRDVVGADQMMVREEGHVLRVG